MDSMGSTATAAGLPCIAGIYLITPGWDDGARLLVATHAALAAGIRVLQYRHKTAPPSLRREQAKALREATRAHGALFIVNDDIDLALAVGADGLHLGRDDGDPAAARRVLPPAARLGVSCYNDFARAQAAVAAGADHVAFGSVFASVTKPGAARASLALLDRARGAGLHVVAIGGIGPGNVAQVAAAGAHAAALISAVYDAPDAGAAARALVDEFERGRRRHELQRRAF